MVRDTPYALRARNEVDDNNLKNKSNNKKDMGNYSTGKADVSNLRRSSRETSVPGQSTPSPLSTRKSKRLENETTPSTSPGTRKSERLEKHKTPSPLSKLVKGKKTLSSSSSGHKKPAKELNLSEEKRTKEKDVIQVTMESEKVEIQLESGRKRKKMSGRTFRRMFKVQCVRTVVLISDDEAIEGADELSVDAIVTDKVDGPSAGDVIKDSQTGPSLKEALSDHEKQATNSSSTMNVDSVDLERSTSLPRPQDGTVPPEIGEKCPDPKDINGLMDESAKISVDAIVMDKVVEGPANGDGLKDSQTGLNSKEVLSDHENRATDSSSIMNVDAVNLERSTSLPRPHDGTVHLEIGEKCPDSKDTNELMDGPEKLSVELTIKDNVVKQPPDGDGLKDSRTSLCENMLPTNPSPIKNVDSLEKESPSCSVRLQNGAISENTESCVHLEASDVAPSPENNNDGFSEICVVCSKRKRVSSGSTEIDLCSCGATVNMDLSRLSTCKGGGDHEAVVTLESAKCCDNGIPIKEPLSDHLMDGSENVCTSSNISGAIMCKRNSRSIADKSSSRFLEYWLPVKISNLQLEQYCAMLLSSSTPLSSCTKNDPVRVLRDTLLKNVRKLCDHPYLLDLSFQDRLINKEKRLAPVVLDVGIKASGKFELLDMMLTEIKNRGSQVLILFQWIPGVKASNGEILAEFLHKRFGEDSYEHVHNAVPSHKKQAAANRFNKKEKGVFVFLLETRACSSAIKLRSLDTVIIYHSDWNPFNDLKALQKMSIGSKLEQIKVFRLYSSFTFEERSLILAKQNVNTENSLQTSLRAIIDNLLIWGASHLFSKLNDYHAESSSSLNVSTQQDFLTEIIGEFRSILSGSCENSEPTYVIAKAYKLDGGGYTTNIPLLGQKKIIVADGQEPHVFWRNLLDRRTPRWKLLGEPCSRSRKRVQSHSKPDTVIGDVGNKRRKTVNENVEPVSVQVELNETEVTDPNRGPSTVANCNQSQQNKGVAETSNLNSNQTLNAAEVNALESAETIALSDERKQLYSSLLAEMIILCHILKLTEDVTENARRFLEYIIKNHHVSSDSPAILHAFLISLCWIAASISKQKVDKKDSLVLAKQHLNYQCTEEYAQSVYSKMRSLKRMYLPEQDVNRVPLNVDEGGANLVPSKLVEVKKEIVENPANEEHELDNKISKIQKKYLKRQEKLLRKQQEKLQELDRIWEKKKQNLENDHKLATAVIRTIYGEGSIRAENLKRLEDGFEMKMKEHNLLMEVELKNLEAEQVAALNEEKQKVEHLIAEAKAKAHSSEPTTVVVPPLLDSRSNDGAGVSQLAMNTNVDATNVVTESTRNLEDQNPNESVRAEENDTEVHASRDQSVNLTTEAQAEVPETAQNENMLQDRINSSSAEQLNQSELVVQNQHNSQAEVAAVEPVDAVTAVHSNGELEDGEVQEGELQEEAPTMENPSTVNSETVPIVDPMPITEQPGTNLPVAENQHTSEIQVEILQPVDHSNNAPSNVELQNQEAPASENERTSEDSALVDPVDPVQPITEQLHADAPTAENQTTLSEVPISVTAETVIPLQSNVEAPCNSDQGRHSSQIAEVAEAELPPNKPIPQNEDLDMRSIAHPLSVEVPNSSQNNVAVTQAVDSAAELANEAVLQEGINVNYHHHRSRYCLHPAAHQFPTLNQPTFIDPLQHEFEKMSKDKDQLEKGHLDMATHLKSDCEKEIEEMTKQIRHKYQMILQEPEAEFTLRKNEIEKNQNKLKMNMKLAEAFRYKCLDVRLPGRSGNQQGASSSGVYMQQMHQLAMQPPPVRIPAGASSTFQPSPSQQNSNSIIQPVRPHPIMLSTVTSHSVTAPPPVQSVQQHTSRARFPTPPSRPPPLISSVTPSRNPRMPTGDLRSPAPHLQSFRPSVVPALPPTTSPFLPQYQPLNGPGLWPRGGLPAQRNLSPSAVALLMEMDRGARVPTNTASVLHEVSPTYASLGGSELGVVVGDVQVNPSSSAVANDVVCLSDDDRHSWMYL